MVDHPAEVAASLAASREDRRPTMPEPPPVSLASVRDVRLPMIAGLERPTDAFYVGMLRFERAEPRDGDEGPVYRADNHDLRLFVLERPGQPESARPTQVMTPFFGEVIERLRADKIEHELVRGLFAGTDGALLQDPSGNWVALAPRRAVR